MSAPLLILDHGRPLQLHYQSLLEYHGGGALTGAALGFQAMVRAAAVLSEAQTWDRRDLQLCSWHSGPGVVDALEFVTRCVSRGRYRQETLGPGGNCGSEQAFRFQLETPALRVQLALREGVVDPRFFALAGRPQRSEREEAQLTGLKASIAAQLMARPARELYLLDVQELSHA